MELQRRLGSMVRSVPPGQQVVIGVGVVVLVMASVLFFRWVTEPSYTVLYSDLEGPRVQEVIDELEAQGVPYQLEAAGSRVMVPRSDVYEVRASLASAGVEGTVVPDGYELLDGQSLTITDFQQRVTYQRALEGELAKTLMAMDAISQATVHLVIPEDPLFEDERQTATASVLVAPSRTLGQGEIESIVFLVSSSVEGLEAENVTVADSAGATLQAAGEDGLVAGIGNRNLRQTREFESALTQDLGGLLSTVLGPGRASAVVRAQLNFDERSVESETFDTEPVPLREQTVEEEFAGQGAAPGGALGVDGGDVVANGDGEYDYTRSEVLREYGIDRQVSSIVEAPGTIERMSVAVVVDDGTNTGAAPAQPEEVERLVAAAVGLDPTRGDVVEVSAIPFPAPVDEPAPAPEAEEVPLLDMVPQIAGAVLLLVVAVSLLVMTRGRRRQPVEITDGGPAPAAIAAPRSPEALPIAEQAVDVGPSPIQENVIDLVQGQPEEIATLLRSWLADRR